jgi:phosphoglucosamine mutase
MMQKLFGTDGIRGRANSYPMTPEMALKTGRAVASYFSKNASASGQIIIGKDTRLSGDMLETALAAGICSMGMDVHLAGILPTPGVSYLTTEMNFAAGIVISASHNPYDDNGIKLFNQDGFKLRDSQERLIEDLILSDQWDQPLTQAQKIGRVYFIDDAVDHYVSFLASTLNGNKLQSFKVVLDCANGATCEAAPKLFEAVGLSAHTIFNLPDGKNINAQCGSQHPEELARKVTALNADIGLAFDGDGDRLIVVDETGAILSGDQILAICAHHLKAKGRLVGNQVVSTVMSNMGFKQALAKMDIDHKTTKVGDRYVMEEMLASGAILGGEDSGHLIFLDHHSTGDGLLAALRLLLAMSDVKRPLSRLSQLMTVFPQVLINVDVKRKPDLNTITAVTDAMTSVEKRLGSEGRVLVRYSGTQPQCRVMVEAPTMAMAQNECQYIAEVIKRAIGK